MILKCLGIWQCLCWYCISNYTFIRIPDFIAPRKFCTFDSCWASAAVIYFGPADSYDSHKHYCQFGNINRHVVKSMKIPFVILQNSLKIRVRIVPNWRTCIKTSIGAWTMVAKKPCNSEGFELQMSSLFIGFQMHICKQLSEHAVAVLLSSHRFELRFSCIPEFSLTRP